MWPDVPFSCTDTGWTWPGVAQCLSLLAPPLAPRFPANVHPGAPSAGPCRVAPQLRLGQLRQRGNQARELSATQDDNPEPGPAHVEHGRPGSTVGAPRPTLAS